MRTGLILLAMVLMAGGPARAQWQLDGAPVAAGPGDQWSPGMISDGQGGAFITWLQTNTWPSDNLIYTQRFDSFGVPLWAVGGVPLTAVPDGQGARMVADGAGGFFVCWFDSRSGNYLVCVQRVNGAGVAQWTPNGVPLSNTGYGVYPSIAADGAGGAIVTWYDFRGADYDIYVQRVNGAGVAQWTANGAPVCTAANGQYEPVVAADGTGGAIIAWYDLRSGNYDVYAQSVNAAGVPQWAVDGVALCSLPAQQSNAQILADGSGGAIVTWRDFRNGNADVYGQRVGASGAAQWTAGGAPICTAPNNQAPSNLVADGAGGFFVGWDDFRNGFDVDIYAQRINPSGVALWPADGVPVCTAADYQYNGPIQSDGAGGILMTWHDVRNGSNFDVYGQRINASGVAQWAFNGVPFCTAAGDQVYPLIVTGGNGAIATWYDWRSGAAEVYAQRIEYAEQYWGHPEPLVVSAADIPGDQGGKVKVNWQASDWDVRHRDTITHYSVWRATDFVPAASQLVTSASEVGPEFHGSAYRREIDAAGDEYYWEWVGNQGAIYASRYSFSAATRSDSTSQSASTHHFQVLSHTANNFVFWVSNVASGRSVDNLAPAAPLYLTAQRIGSDVHLKWNGVHVPDLKNYAVYRATSAGVTPAPVNFLAGDDDTLLVDAGAPNTALYYIVTAYDVHENQSTPSNEAGASAATGVGNTPSITALTLLQNHPNPFAGSTELEIGLPAGADVSVRIYDVAGRLVREQTLRGQQAGWQRLRFDGRDGAGRTLASGVYFCRVEAAGATVTRKMVIAR